MKKIKLSLIGLLQALGIVAYCALISGLFWFLGKFMPQPSSQFMVMAFILVLLVFSAAVTGAIVFAYPAILALDKKFKQALMVFAYTLLYIVLFVLIGITALGYLFAFS